MKLSTSSQVGKAFRHLKTLIDNIDKMNEFGIDTVTLESAAKDTLNAIIARLEAFPVEQNYSTRFKFNMVLESGCWFPVDSFELNSQGGCIWAIKVNESITAEHGTSRFGQFADIDAEGLPCMNITLDDVRKQNINFI